MTALAYWFVGYGLSREGENGFIGGNDFFHVGIEERNSTLQLFKPYVIRVSISFDECNLFLQEQYAKWFFEYVFCLAVVSIVSGTVVERCQFWVNLILPIVISSTIQLKSKNLDLYF